jgi:putative restriction endonuclease
LRFWWVNQNQTFRQEHAGGYLWSPKRKANRQRNPFYEFMREVAPGDVIFAFANTRIEHIGIARSTAYEAPKPPEFGNAGPTWSQIGWKVSVRYFRLNSWIRPADHMNVLGPVLPRRYSPLQSGGSGNQGVYLTELTAEFAEVLIGLIGIEGRQLVVANRADTKELDVHLEPAPEINEWEDYLIDQISSDRSIDDTERAALIKARRGQGQFRDNVRRIENCCRVTQVENPEHLVASHTKPWRDCESADERLDGENGFLLTPTIDHLFDRGFISFEDRGRLLISPVADLESLARMRIPLDEPLNVGPFTAGQRQYLEYHRDSVFLSARVDRT